MGNPVIDNIFGVTRSPDGRIVSRYDYSNQMNIAEADKQRRWEEMMWDKANEYNSPEAQMQRLRNAGLNPSLVNGFEPVAAGVPTGAEASSVAPDNGNFDRLLGLGKDAVFAAAKLPAEVDLLKAQAQEVRSRIPLNQQRVVNLQKSLEDIDASIKKKLSDVERNGVLNRLTDTQTENIIFQQGIAQQSLDQAERRLVSEIGVNDQKINESKQAVRESLSRQNLNEENLNQMIAFFALKKALAGSEILKNLEQKDYFKAAANQANETADKLKKEGMRIDQIINMDKPSEDRAKQMYDDANSDNPITRFGGQLMYAIDYGADNILGAFLK